MIRSGTIRRRWRFATAAFDEASWTLFVDGARVPMEAKPLHLLHELLIRAGDLVTKDELIDVVWPDTAVVEGSLSTAILKLRKAIGDTARDRPIIETVRRIGYRIAVPVDVEFLNDPAATDGLAETRGSPQALPALVADRPSHWRSIRRHPFWSAAAAGTLFVGGALIVAGPVARYRAASAVLPTVKPGAAQRFDQFEVREALRKLDVDKIDGMIHAGWNPNAFLDNERNNSIYIALNVCEWDPGHDQRKLLLLVRTLMDGGARLDIRNVWGDTAYSIASAKRYCGPNHPVTRMIKKLCYDGYRALGDRCLGADQKAAPRE